MRGARGASGATHTPNHQPTATSHAARFTPRAVPAPHTRTTLARHHRNGHSETRFSPRAQRATGMAGWRFWRTDSFGHNGKVTHLARYTLRQQPAWHDGQHRCFSQYVMRTVRDGRRWRPRPRFRRKAGHKACAVANASDDATVPADGRCHASSIIIPVFTSFGYQRRLRVEAHAAAAERSSTVRRSGELDE